MVVKRTIAHLRTRPHHERHAVALWASLLVMFIVFLLWGFLFFRNIRIEATVSVTEVPVTTTQ